MEEEFLEKIKHLEKKYGGRIGLYATNLTSGETLQYRKNERFGTASVIKIPLLITYFRKCQEGIFDFSAAVRQKELYLVDIPEESGVLKRFPNDSLIPMEVVAMLMIYLSDNVATNIFLHNFTSKDFFNSAMRDLRYSSTYLTVEKLSSKIFYNAKEDIGYSTPEELARILGDVMQYKTLEKKYTEKLLEYMSLSYLGWRLTRNLPRRSRYENRAVIKRYGSKSGTFTRLNIVNDLAFVSTNDGQDLVISCMMNGLEDKNIVCPLIVDSIHNKLFGEIGEAVFRLLKLRNG